jgi:hypothetical protein
MQVFHKLAIASLLVVVGVFSTTAFAQDEDRGFKSDLRVSTAIGIGITGTKVSTKFELVDELGMAYDVMSLLREKSLRESLEVTDEQYQEMVELHGSITAKLKANVASAILTDNKSELIEQPFYEMENKLRAILSPDQVIQMEQAKHQIGIKRFGLSKFMTTKRMQNALGLAGDDFEKFGKRDAELKAEHKNQVKNLIRRANNALLNELSQSQKSNIDKLSSNETMAEFLKSNLFVDGKTRKKNLPAAKKSLIRLLRKKNVRNSIAMNDAQLKSYAELKQHADAKNDDQFEKKVNQILNPTQVKKLAQIQMQNEIEHYGTVHALSFGLLSKSLGLTEDESKRFFDVGKVIYAELTEDITKSEFSMVQKFLATLPGDKRDRAIEMIGDRAITNLK